MTFTSKEMLENAAAAAQHFEIVDSEVVQGAILRSVKQYIELNWACTSQDLIDGLEAHPNFKA